MKKLLIFLSLVFCVSNVLALGVTPARTTLDFEPGLIREGTITIVNSEGVNLNLVLSVQGDLKDYISLSASELSLSSSQDSATVDFFLSLPEDGAPGLSTAEIVVLQLPDEIGSDESYVGAALAVVSQVYVYAPYPGKYASGDYSIVASEGSGVDFIATVLSQGEFDLESVVLNVDIYDSSGNRVDSFNSDSVEIPSGSRKDIVAHWGNDFSVGDYVAKVNVLYDEEVLNLGEENFGLGSADIELQQVEVKNFNLGDIAKVEMVVENLWSEAMEDVYVQTEIYNDRGGLMADFKSQTYTIDALSKKVLVSYWDTAGVRVGDYTSKIILKYSDREIPSEVEFQVREDSLSVVGLGYVISSSGSDDGMNSIIWILVIVIAVLVLMNLLWFFLLRKRLSK